MYQMSYCSTAFYKPHCVNASGPATNKYFLIINLSPFIYLEQNLACMFWIGQRHWDTPTGSNQYFPQPAHQTWYNSVHWILTCTFLVFVAPPIGQAEPMCNLKIQRHASTIVMTGQIFDEKSIF